MIDLETARATAQERRERVEQLEKRHTAAQAQVREWSDKVQTATPAKLDAAIAAKSTAAGHVAAIADDLTRARGLTREAQEAVLELERAEASAAAAERRPKIAARVEAFRARILELIREEIGPEARAIEADAARLGELLQAAGEPIGWGGPESSAQALVAHVLRELSGPFPSAEFLSAVRGGPVDVAA